VGVLVAPWLIGTLVALWIGTAVAADPEVVGSVRASEAVAQSKTQDGVFKPVSAGPGQPSAPVYCPGGVKTDQHGRVSVQFENDSVVTLEPNTHLEIDRRQDGRFSDEMFLNGLNLRDGAIQVVHSPGGRCLGTAPNGTEIRCKGTKFIVRYDVGTRTADVVVVAGAVEVRNTRAANRRPVMVGERERTLVVGSKPPTSPTPVDPATLREQLARFEFVGRGAEESLAPFVRPDPDTGPLPQAGQRHVPSNRTLGDITGPSAAPGQHD
jgi:hypothetical protein